MKICDILMYNRYYGQVYALHEIGLINDEWLNEYDAKHYSLENKLIAYNKAQIKILKDKGDWQQDYILREEQQTYPDDVSLISITQPYIQMKNEK